MPLHHLGNHILRYEGGTLDLREVVCVGVGVGVGVGSCVYVVFCKICMQVHSYFLLHALCTHTLNTPPPTHTLIIPQMISFLATAFP